MGIAISNTLAILPDGNSHAVGRHDLFIEGTDIVGIDRAPEGFIASETIDGSLRLTIPGLINAHTHGYMSLMRNTANDLPFMTWLFDKVDPIEQQMEHEDAYWASLLSQMEMIRSGTTCFNDMQMHIGMTTRAVVESGMRAVICRGLVGDDYDERDRRLIEALNEREGYAGCERLSFRLGPHAPYTCGPEYLRLVVDVAHREGMGIHTHLSESRAEVDNMQRERGCTPVEYLRDAGIFELPTIAAHCVHLSDTDRAILAEYDVSVVTNPASNMILGNGFAGVPELMAAGINVCLGTDGPASNNAQNMIREMGLLALIHKGTHEDPECLSADTVLRMATRNAAAALGLPTGSIEVGKKADLALLDLNAPSLVPLGRPTAALCYSANGSEVCDVLIDGKPIMRNREMLTIDEERVRHEIARICQRLGLD